MLYVGNQDALVAFYPELLDESGFNDFTRTEMNIML